MKFALWTKLRRYEWPQDTEEWAEFYLKHAGKGVLALVAVNALGLVLLFCGISALEAAVPASSIGLGWWSLFLHIAVVASAYAAYRRGFSQMLSLFASISSVMLMLVADKCVQLSDFTASKKIDARADVVVAGAIICLLATLPMIALLTVPVKKSTQPGNYVPTQPTRESKTVFSDLQEMEEGRTTGATAPISDSGGVQFKQYQNPAAHHDNSDGQVIPALQQARYPAPPKDLPPSPGAHRVSEQSYPGGGQQGSRTNASAKAAAPDRAEKKGRSQEGRPSTAERSSYKLGGKDAPQGAVGEGKEQKENRNFVPLRPSNPKAGSESRMPSQPAPGDATLMHGRPGFLNQGDSEDDSDEFE